MKCGNVETLASNGCIYIGRKSYKSDKDHTADEGNETDKVLTLSWRQAKEPCNPITRTINSQKESQMKHIFKKLASVAAAVAMAVTFTGGSK